MKVMLLSLGWFSVSDRETPESLRLKLLPCLGNFTWTLQEAVTGRVVPDGEILVPYHEYHPSFRYDLPVRRRFHESLAPRREQIETRTR